jgi:hypothetical protein
MHLLVSEAAPAGILGPFMSLKHGIFSEKIQGETGPY